ncbi:MAG: FMN-binding protein [Verrucomicrobia bacterium]|nr:FMN-binding protein [Verrucomicrobiota bacterium]
MPRSRLRQTAPWPKPWRAYLEAQVHEAGGDVLAGQRSRARARAAYERATRLYQAVPPEASVRLAASHATVRVNAQADLLDDDALRSARLRDGAFVADASGYSDHIRATVTVRNTRIEEVKLEHQEKADLGARAILPKRLIEQQTVRVDGITGATVTSEAIKTAVFQALKKSAGL